MPYTVKRIAFLVVTLIAVMLGLTNYFSLEQEASFASKPTTVSSHTNSLPPPKPESKHNNPYKTNKEDSSSANNPVEQTEPEQLTEPSASAKRLSWQQALSEELSEQDSLALIEMSPHPAANALAVDAQLLNEVIDKLQSLAKGEQRAFLLKVISQSSPEIQSQVANELLASARLLDRQASVSLIMHLENQADKAMLCQLLLQTETDEQVLASLLAHLSSDDDKTFIAQSVDELHTIVQHHDSAQIKGLALQTIMKIDPQSNDTFDSVIELISTDQATTSYQGLNILHQQLNDYGKTLTEAQKQATEQLLNQISNDDSQPKQNSEKAQAIIELLEKHY